MSVTFGVFDHLDSSGVPLRDFYEDRLRLTEAYDRLGFHAYHVAEHHATPLGMAPSPSVYLAAVAQRTTRLILCPLVYTLPLYHPLRVVEEVCMLDQMSGGRLQFGVGKGISPIETRHYGVDPDKATRMFTEAFEVLMRGLAGRTLDYEGEFYRFKNVPLELEPLQKPHPPLWYGTSTADSAERPARQGMSIVTNAPAAAAHAIIARYRSCFGGGDAQPKLGIGRHIVIADSDGAAMDIARRAYGRWRASFMKLWEDHGVTPPGGGYPETYDDPGQQGRALAGTPRTVADALQAQLDECGANYVVCRIAFGSLSYADALRTTELLASEVMPRLRAKEGKERVAAE